MSVRRVLVAVALVALAAGGTAALLLRSGDESTAGRADTDESPEIAAQVSLTPRSLLFGDTLEAAVGVTVDRRRVDPDSVRIRQPFASWGLVRPPERVRHDADNTTFLRTTYTLRCVIGPCVPPRTSAQLEFDPAQIGYRRMGGRKAQTLEVRWPVLVVHSNIVTSDFEQREALNSPWKADLLSLPLVSYALSPGVLRGLLLGAAALLAVLGAALAFLAVPKRVPHVEPEPEPEPEPALPPLELALMLLTTEAQVNGTADRRRALELVAEEMEERREFPLARRARVMAWSEDVPALAETRGLAESVRARLAELEPEPEPEPEAAFEEDHASAP